MWVVNPLVPGSNPGGPTNTGQLKYDPYRPLRSHRSCRPRSRIYLACILPFRKASQYGSVFTLFHLRCSSTTSLRVSESPILHTSVAEPPVPDPLPVRSHRLTLIARHHVANKPVYLRNIRRTTDAVVLLRVQTDFASTRDRASPADGGSSESSSL